MDNIVHISEESRSEFSVDDKGQAFATRRATARLCGLKHHSSISNLLKKISNSEVANWKGSESLFPFVGQDFEGGYLPDIFVCAIIEYYAFDAGRYCTLEALKFYRAFANIGLRTWIQQEVGWSDPRILELESKYDQKLDTLKQDFQLALEENNRKMGILQETMDRHQEIADVIRSAISIQSQADRKFFGIELNRIERKVDRFLDRFYDDFEDIKKALGTDDLQAMIRRYQWLKSIAGAYDFRVQINIMVQAYSERNNVSGGIIYNYLYAELHKACGYDVRERSNEIGCSCIETIAIDGHIDTLWSIAKSNLL